MRAHLFLNAGSLIIKRRLVDIKMQARLFFYESAVTINMHRCVTYKYKMEQILVYIKKQKDLVCNLNPSAFFIIL